MVPETHELHHLELGLGRHPPHHPRPRPALAAQPQGDAPDETHGPARPADEGIAGEIQGRAPENERPGHGPLQKVRRQPGQRLPPRGPPDPDLLRPLHHAAIRRRAARPRLPLGQRPRPARHAVPHRRVSHQSAPARHGGHHVHPDGHDPEEPGSEHADATAHLHVHAVLLPHLLLQLRRRPRPLLDRLQHHRHLPVMGRQENARTGTRREICHRIAGFRRRARQTGKRQA